MDLEARKYLFDARQAAENIRTFTAGKSFQDYEIDLMLRSAVERQFEIVGEALSGLTKVAPEIAAEISNHKQIISFRNRLIHGYASVSNEIVWGVIESKLSELASQIEDKIDEDA